jgi:hypothetical protein
LYYLNGSIVNGLTPEIIPKDGSSSSKENVTIIYLEVMNEIVAIFYIISNGRIKCYYKIY